MSLLVLRVRHTFDAHHGAHAVRKASADRGGRTRKPREYDAVNAHLLDGSVELLSLVTPVFQHNTRAA